MRENIHFKSTMRQRLRTLLLYLLMTAISFAFVARATEYIIIQRETERLGGFYRSIGMLVPDDPDIYNITEGAAIVGESQYVKINDLRRYASATLNGMDNSDFDGGFTHPRFSTVTGMATAGNRTSDVIACGVLTSIEEPEEKLAGYPRNPYYCTLIFKVDSVESARPEYQIAEGDCINIIYDFADENELAAFLSNVRIGGRYLVRGYFDQYMVNNYATKTPLTEVGMNLASRPLTQGGPWLLPMESGASVDYAAPALAGLIEDIGTQEENWRAMMVTGTKDMTAIHYFQEAYRYIHLAEGRWLDGDDDLNARRVCVVSEKFADARGLSVGDTVSLTFRGLDFPFWFGYTLDLESEDPRDSPTYTEEFEIVGIHGYIPANINVTGVGNLVFIPDSVMPGGFGKYLPDTVRYLSSLFFYVYDSYSFVLDTPRNQDAFVIENRTALAELGLKIELVENGAENFWASTDPLQRAAAINVAVMGFVLIISLILAVFIYIRSRRQDFAVARALGTPKSAAIRQMLVPIICIGGLGIASGGALSWNYALREAAHTLAGIEVTTLNVIRYTTKGVDFVATLSPFWLMAFCGGIFALLMICAFSAAHITARRPVLELLQGAAATKKKKPQKASPLNKVESGPLDDPSESEEVLFHTSLSVPALDKRPKGAGHGLAHWSRFIFRHMRRSGFKSAFVVLLALLSVLALGWMNLTMLRNEEETTQLYENLLVDIYIMPVSRTEASSKGQNVIKPSEFYGEVSLDTASAVVASGLVCEASVEAELKSLALATSASPGDEAGLFFDTERLISVDVYGNTNPELEKVSLVSVRTVEYAEGFDSSLFSENWTRERLARHFPATEIPSGLFEQAVAVYEEQGLVLEEIQPFSLPVCLNAVVMEQMGFAFGDAFYLIYQALEDNEVTTAVPCIIVGRFTSRLQTAQVLAPLSALETFGEIVGWELSYGRAIFTVEPSRNHELAEVSESVEKLMTPDKLDLDKLNVIVWDEELRMVMEPMERNLQLMRVLFPVTVAVTVVIAMGLSFLITLQRAKDAAIMRVLGCGKELVRWALCAEQIVLCILGLAMGVGLFAALRFEALSTLIVPLITCSALYLLGTLAGSTWGAVSVTGRMPLDLLQVKE